jgi:DMSO reductase anchor subunit
MRPAFSVILFTVLSGAGLGLFALLALAQLLIPAAALGPNAHLAGGAAALVLVAAGLVSSTFHLANPKNAWRAFARFRSSWLSREGVLAALFFPLAAGYLAAAYLEAGTAWTLALGLAAVALAWGTLYSTAMIYACLKTIPQWHDRLVPAAYLANGHLSGALILVALATADGTATTLHVVLVLVALAAAAVMKWRYYQKFRAPRQGAHTLAAAVDMTAAQAKLLDAGHSHGTFLTREFMFQLGRSRTQLLRALFFLLSVVAPIAILPFGVHNAWLLGAAALACMLGLLIERWLFFAEAQHVVRLFHGQQAV